MRSFLSIAPIMGWLLYATASGASSETAKKNSIVPGGYLVEFEETDDQNTFYDGLNSTGIEVSTRMNLTYTLFNGASFQLQNTTNENETIHQILSMASVKKIWPLRVYSLPIDKKVSLGGSATAAASGGLRKRANNNDTVQGDVFSPHVMTQVDKLRALGYTGKGVKVAVIDTGVDYNHPALGGCFGEGCLVSYGYDLVGDAYTGLNTPIPDDDPLDCLGHGTHVSGIIAAQPNEWNFTGAAPDVTLGAYKVFGCYDNVGDDVLISAFNMAYEAGSDIITSSIGGESGWSESPWAVTVQRIVEAGVPCTISAGNDGAEGVFFTSGAADGKLVTAVASFDNWEYPAFLVEGFYNTSSEATQNTFGWTQGTPAFGNITMPLWALSNDSTIEADGCDPLPTTTPDLSEYIVLIRRGICTFATKAENAAAYGAKYIMFYANTGALVAVSLDEASIKGAGMVTQDQGAAWVKALNAGEDVYLDIIDADFTPNIFQTKVNDVTGGYASTYTSWGPTWDIDFYPDVGAPGGSIFSTYPLSQGGYAVLSGTSMACPIVAAIYALVGQARGTFDPITLGNLLTTTAKSQLYNDGTTTYGVLGSAAQQGPGMIQAYDAAFATTLINPASISFNDTDHFTETASFAIDNIGSDTVTYTIGHVAALTVYTLDGSGNLQPAAFPNPTADATATLSFSLSTIEIAAGTSANITVTPSPPVGLDASLLPVYSGYITINGTNGENFAVPYLGVAGSMYNATNLDPVNTYLMSYTDETGSPVSAGKTFTVPYPTLAAAEVPSPDVSYPSALYQTNLGSALVRVDVIPLSADYDGNKTTVLGNEIAGSVYGYPMGYIARDVWVAPFTGLLADGSVVPEGQYQLTVSALRIFGDLGNEEDYTTINTVPFTLKYE